MTRRIVTAMYNPHLLSREDLVASFVARRPLLDVLVDDLRRGAHQHHLLVGSRGSGKTTLLLRLAVAIEDDKKLARTALPLRFPEEQYNVARPSDFWLNCLDALADVLEARGDQQGKRKLEAAVAELEPLPEGERSEAALAALTGWAKQAGKQLVLLVDNLDLILQRLRESQWGLRESLSTDNWLVLIGATSTFLDDAVAYESPLYDFFHVHELDPLSEEAAREVVKQFATRTRSSHVQAVLETEPERFQALYVLTGGMPRMLAVLAGVLAADESSVDADLEQMLDQMTPHYKALFDELPDQSQIIVNAVALHWHPITAAVCAERTRLDINLVSAQLNRLVRQGLLAKVSLHGTGRLGFQLTERFFNIWYLMRASRRARQKLAWFVEFLRVFHGEEELSRRVPELGSAAPVIAAEQARTADWSQTRHQVRRALEHHLEDPRRTDWTSMMRILRACVRQGHAPEATELVAELGLADRWLPLYEALRAASDDAARLNHVAPEVRTAAARILELLQQPEPPAGSPDPVPPAATEKAAPKRRARSR